MKFPKTEMISVPRAPYITIQISQDIIDKSEKSTTGKCMVAQALREEGFMSVNVNAERASFNKDGFRYHYTLPGRAKQAVIQFDKNKKLVKPFTLKLHSHQASVAPVVVKGPQNTKNRKPYTRQDVARNCKRRFHGLTMIMAK